MLDNCAIRKDFPLLATKIHGKELIYLDNAATTQKPLSVIERLHRYYCSENTNIHRGAHFLANQATDYYESGRERIRSFINAEHSHEIIFTRGTTESINLVAHSFVQQFVEEGDEVLLSEMEHHSNIVPWQLSCSLKGARIKVIPMDGSGMLRYDLLPELLSDRTRLVALTAISNALGTVNSCVEVIRKAHEKGIPVLIDGAQEVPHHKVDVRALDCDFYCFSGHKMYAPMGIGVLYGKEHYLKQMPPYQGGGEMIQKVMFDRTTYNHLPFKFEAGTPNVEGVLGLHTAIDYLENIGLEEIETYEKLLLAYAVEQLKTLPEIRLIGDPDRRSGLISFLMTGAHPYDVGTLLDQLGVAVRTGHHCAQPVMDFFDIPGTVRASFSFYNNEQEVDEFIKALKKVRSMLL